MTGPTMHRSIALAAGPLLVAVALASGCGAATPSVSESSPLASPAPSPIPIVIDTDMGADDILAIAMLVHEPTVEVRAITVAGTGLAHCAEGLRNLRGVLHQLGIRGLPIGCGSEDPGPDGRPFPDAWRAGTDAAYGLNLPPVPASDAGADAVALLTEVLGASETPVTMVVLGPWTNLAAFLEATPEAASQVERLHVMGGTLDAPGNVAEDDGALIEPALEWNLAADPSAVNVVLAHELPVSLVSLDATDQVPLDEGVLDALAADHAGAGANLAYELFTLNGYMLTGGTFLWDELAAATLVDRNLVSWERATLAVDAAGHLSRDDAGTAVEITTAADPDAALDAVLAALRRGPPRPDPFEVVGSIELTWDGESCTMTEPDRPGFYTATLANTSDETAIAYIVTVAAPAGWSDVQAFVAAIGPEEPTVVPDWLGTPIQLLADPGTTVEAGGALAADILGPVCVTSVDADAPVLVVGSPTTLDE